MLTEVVNCKHNRDRVSQLEGTFSCSSQQFIITHAEIYFLQKRAQLHTLLGEDESAHTYRLLSRPLSGEQIREYSKGITATLTQIYST